MKYKFSDEQMDLTAASFGKKKRHYLKIISAKIKREQNIETPKPAELKG